MVCISRWSRLIRDVEDEAGAKEEPDVPSKLADCDSSDGWGTLFVVSRGSIPSEGCVTSLSELLGGGKRSKAVTNDDLLGRRPSLLRDRVVNRERSGLGEVLDNVPPAD